MDIKSILRSYYFESMPLFRSHEEYFSALEDFENLWKKLESCRIEAKITTIHDKSDQTTSCTSDDDRKTVISSILERFPSLLEENSKLKKTSRNLALSHRLTMLYKRGTIFVLFKDVYFTMETFDKE